MVSNFHRLNDEIDPDANFQRYSLRSNLFAELILPLCTPPRRRRITVSCFGSNYQKMFITIYQLV
jgi:hypothetical protein